MRKILIISFLILASIASVKAEFWDGGSVNINNGVLDFRHDQHNVNISITIVVDGEERIITDKLDYWKIRLSNGFKWGANITIPDSAAGGFIADNLEEIRFNVVSNINLKKVNELGQHGFSFSKENKSNGVVSSVKNIYFNFSDIVETYNNIPHYSRNHHKHY